ncbi:GL21753 [Drosophila persimilis]|uniref:GL21753 n=1 Tax=Drosophila persimilis TaxID=7234 RepID=B4GER5_DROPE|nr:GL21753 [Drosophila persimilis]
MALRAEIGEAIGSLSKIPSADGLAVSVTSLRNKKRQSDIKRLRRENEQLRREIWTLRDECDRLNKRFKAKLNEHEFGGCRGSGGSGGTCHAYRCSGEGGRGSGGCDVNSDDSDSCDTCRGADDGHCSDDCCQEGGSCAPLKPPLPPEVPATSSSSKNEDSSLKAEQQQQQQPMHFDHLSVVSEETLSNPEMLQQFQQQEHRMLCTPDLNGSQSTLPSLMGPLTPLTPIELVANQMNDLHASVPPLSYFENILSQHMGNPNSALTPTPELGEQFEHHHWQDHAPHQWLGLQSPQTMPKIALNAPHLPESQGDIETVAITTNATQQALNSPKHFFAPLKPRLRLNTKLANQGQCQGQLPDSLPPGSPPPPLRDPPDIFVNNALASPYQRRVSPQVSPRRHRAHSHCHAHQHPRQHPSQRHDQDHDHDHNQEQEGVPQHPHHCALHRAVVDVAAAVGLGFGPAANASPRDKARPHPGSSVLDIYTAALANAAVARCAPLPMPNSAAEPIYATAQKPCQSTCISATALTKPVMTITTNTTKTTTSPMRLPAKVSKVQAKRETVSQTDSVNLESILNDIETISEDILAIQLEKSKSRDNLSHRQDNDKAKKPYRSEMNLYLQYDGTNPTISPATATATTESQSGGAGLTTTATSSGDSGNSGNSKLMRRTRSLEREHTDSPAPHIPDPMAPFPDKCTYLGFEQINQAAAGPQQSPNGQRPPISAKPRTEAETAAEQAAQTEADELARRKARRVSILCGSGQAPEDAVAPVTTAPMATASCVDLPTAVLTPPSIKAFKISHSTPSSPHSSRRRTNSNTMAVPGHPEVTATTSAPPSTSHHHHHRKEGSDPAPMTTATVSRTKCSRRHSEGTVHTVHRNSGASGGGAGGGGHHHHHNHHHPHSGMAISNNPHHSHHSHQDSNHETATSLSDRNSNSFASSRESSTSFSMRSTRRKISISSHTGGKIPWCGCWGNGCL